VTPVIPEINANTNIVCAQGTVQYTVNTAILLYNTERTIQICWIVEQRLFLKMFIRFIFQTILTANTIDRNGRYAFISWYSSSVGFLKTDQKLSTSRSQCMWWFGQEYILFMESFYVYTLKRISNWPPSFCYILRKVFGEKYKQPNIGLIQFISNVSNKTSLKFDHWNKLKLKG